MERGESRGYYAMLAVTIALTLCAVVTLLPNPSASKPNVLGYRSVCSFAPSASALCGLLAGVICFFRNRRVSRAAASTRYQPLFLPIGVAGALVFIAVFSGVRFGAAEARFGEVLAKTGTTTAQFASAAEGVRTATFSEGEVSATVELSIRSGRITGLRLIEGRNVDGELAARIFARVAAAGSTAVDAVSGATASSNVLLKAIEAAAETR